MMLSCTANTGDCNGASADGCEASLLTTMSCGACNKPCAPPHAAGDCSTGMCTRGACDPGFGDCNGLPEDGCEQSLNDPKSCGACGKQCPSGVECLEGVCACQKHADCPGPDGVCCNGRCAHSTSACFVWPCIPGTELPKEMLNCGGCGSMCLLWCCSGGGDAGASGM
jgi:hypothetical protein